MLVAPAAFWEALPPEAQTNVARWLSAPNKHELHDTNWLFFRVLANLALATASLVTTGNENTNSSGRSTTTTSSTMNRMEFRSIGTSIDCLVRQTPDGKFWVRLNVQDSSIFTTDSDTRTPLKLADPMAFRTFTFSNELPMRDGQTAQWASATDKITGEILRLDATLTVVK